MKERKAAEQESRLLSQLEHLNIVQYKESFETPDSLLFIAMGFCEGGDLYTKIKMQKGVLLTEKQVVEWLVQIAMALKVGGLRWWVYIFLAFDWKFNFFVTFFFLYIFM